ncbi:MAG: hypothetical protein ACK4OM_06805 [Alphaproteobacteria bacterium]
MYIDPYSPLSRAILDFRSLVSHYYPDGTIKPFEVYRAELTNLIADKVAYHTLDVTENGSSSIPPAQVRHTASNAAYWHAKQKLIKAIDDFWNFKIFTAWSDVLKSSGNYLNSLFIDEYDINLYLKWKYKFEGFKYYGEVNYSQFNSNGTLKDIPIYEYNLKSLAEKLYYDHKLLEDVTILSNMTYATMNFYKTIQSIGSVIYYPFVLITHPLKFVYYLAEKQDVFSAINEIMQIPVTSFNFFNSIIMVAINSLTTLMYAAPAIFNICDNVLNFGFYTVNTISQSINLAGKGVGYTLSFIGENLGKSAEKLFETVADTVLLTEASFKFAYHVLRMQWFAAGQDAIDFCDYLIKVPIDIISSVGHILLQVKTAIQYPASYLYSGGVYIFDFVKDIGSFIFENIVEFSMPVFEVDKEFLEYRVEILKEYTSNLKDSLTEAIKDIAEYFKENATEIGQEIKDSVSNLLELISQGCKNSWEYLGEINYNLESVYLPSKDNLNRYLTNIKSDLFKFILKCEEAINKLWIIDLPDEKNVPEEAIYQGPSFEEVISNRKTSYIDNMKNIVNKFIIAVEENKEYYLNSLKTWWSKNPEVLDIIQEQDSNFAIELSNNNYVTDDEVIEENVTITNENFISSLSSNLWNKIPSFSNLYEIIAEPVNEIWHNYNPNVQMENLDYKNINADSEVKVEHILADDIEIVGNNSYFTIPNFITNLFSTEYSS